MSNPFWDFSVYSYDREGVADVCIALQDGSGLDVNVLLYGAWLAACDRRLEASHLRQLEAVILPWRERVVHPLRALRRQWRDYPEAVDIREQLKLLETEAEKEQQDMMLGFYRAAAPLPEGPRPLRENLLLVAQSGCADEPRWHSSIQRLVALLSL